MTTPNDEKTTDRATAADVPRRGVLAAMFGSVVGLGFAALGAVAGLWTAGTARFMVPNVVTEPPNRFKVGSVDDYPQGHVETRYKEKHGVWIVHGTERGEGRIYALDTACTHLGCITTWQENRRIFKCPCHGSGFRIDGVHFEGPAPRPLVRYAIRIAEDGLLEIDKSRTFREELGQWTEPDSYVVV